MILRLIYNNLLSLLQKSLRVLRIGTVLDKVPVESHNSQHTVLENSISPIEFVSNSCSQDASPLNQVGLRNYYQQSFDLAGSGLENCNTLTKQIEYLNRRRIRRLSDLEQLLIDKGLDDSLYKIVKSENN